MRDLNITAYCNVHPGRLGYRLIVAKSSQEASQL